MNIFVKLTKIVYLLFLTCFFQADMPDCRQPGFFTASAAVDRLHAKTVAAGLFTDIIGNNLEEAEAAAENEYKRPKKNKKNKNIWLLPQLPVLTHALSSRYGFNHKKSLSDFTSLNHDCVLPSVILRL